MEKSIPPKGISALCAFGRCDRVFAGGRVALASAETPKRTSDLWRLRAFVGKDGAAGGKSRVMGSAALTLEPHMYVM